MHPVRHYRKEQDEAALSLHMEVLLTLNHFMHRSRRMQAASTRLLALALSSRANNILYMHRVASTVQSLL